MKKRKRGLGAIGRLGPPRPHRGLVLAVDVEIIRLFEAIEAQPSVATGKRTQPAPTKKK